MLSNGSVYMDDVDERVSCTCEVYERVSWMFGMNKSRHNMTFQPMFPLTMQRKLAAMVPLSLFNLKVLDEACLGFIVEELGIVEQVHCGLAIQQNMTLLVCSSIFMVLLEWNIRVELIRRLMQHHHLCGGRYSCGIRQYLFKLNHIWNPVDGSSTLIWKLDASSLAESEVSESFFSNSLILLSNIANDFLFYFVACLYCQLCF